MSGESESDVDLDFEPNQSSHSGATLRSKRRRSFRQYRLAVDLESDFLESESDSSGSHQFKRRRGRRVSSSSSEPEVDLDLEETEEEEDDDEEEVTTSSTSQSYTSSSSMSADASFSSASSKSSARMNEEDNNGGPKEEAKKEKRNTSHDEGKYGAEAALQCIICLDFAVSPIISCMRAGHTVCGICYDKLKMKKCPMCQSHLERCSFAEKMAKNMEVRVPCLNAELGCTQQPVSTKAKQHFADCFFRDVECSLIGCVEQEINAVPMTSYLNHLDRVHGKKQSVLHHLRFSTRENVNDTVIFPLLDFHLTSFVLFMTMESKTVNFYAKILGDEDRAKRYKCKVKFLSCNNTYPFMKSSFIIPVIPFHSIVDTSIKTNLIFGSMNRKRLSTLAMRVGGDMREINVRATVKWI